MTEYTWSEWRDKACRWYGDTPSKTTEAAIIEVFRTRPAAVVRELESIADAVRAGNVRSGWAVARNRIASLASSDTVATDETEQRRALAAGRAWVRNVGHAYDRESEVVDELFGPYGRLRQWPELRDRVLEEWRRHVEV